MMTDEVLNEMVERSKDDRATFVGSEIRQLVGEIRRAREAERVARHDVAAIDALVTREFGIDYRHREAMTFDDELWDQTLRDRDQYEALITDVARWFGCKDEWSSAHDHSDCVREFMDERTPGPVAVSQERQA